MPITMIADECSIGVDLGGTSLRIGLYDSSFELQESISMPTRVGEGPEAVVADIAGSIDKLIAKHGVGDELTSIGVGSPGPINLDEGTLGQLPNFPGWNNFPLHRRIEEATSLEVYLECDANAAALAELKFGAGKSTNTDSMCMLTLGTGVGSGIIIDGEIWHGMVGMAGEAGHVSLAADGPLCACGSRGCLELYTSANGLCRSTREMIESGCTGALADLVYSNPGFSPLDVALLARAGNLEAKQVYKQLGFYLGFSLAGLVNLLDLPLYVIGGGLASAWDLFESSMFETLRNYSYVYRLAEPTQRLTREQEKTYVCFAHLGASAGLLGAALLPSFCKDGRPRKKENTSR